MRRKTILMVCASLVVAILCLASVVRVLWQSNVGRLEEFSVRQDVVHTQKALEQMLGRLDLVAMDRAFSDAACEAVERADPRFVGDCLSPQAFASLKLDVALLFDNDGHMVFGSGFDPDRKMMTPLPQGLRPHLNSGDLLLRNRLGEIGLQGIVMLPEGPLMVATRPILPSNRRGEPKGTTVVGRFLDADVVEELSLMADRPVTLNAFADMAQHPGREASISALSAQGILVGPVSENRTTGYGLVKDIYGQSALVLSVSGPRTFYQQGQTGTRYFVLCFLTVCLLFGVTTIWVVERMVLSRLHSLIRDVDRVTVDVNSGARVTVEGDDELTELEQAVNSMLHRLDESGQEIAASERRFRDVAVNTSDWIWETDASGRHTFCTDRIAQVLGFTANEMVGRSLGDAVALEQAPGETHRLSAILAERQPFQDLDLGLATRFGAVVQVQLSGVPMYEEGRFVGYRGVGKDMSYRQRAEEAERLAAVGQLAAGVAHEFNNILAAMSMSSEMALAIDSLDRHRQNAELVHKCTERGARICRNLLRFARPEQPRLAPIAIEAAIDAALAMGVREIANAEISVTRDYRAAGSPMLADGGKLEQVFLNLIINACHAMPDGGVLTCQTRTTPLGGVIVRISDTGTGIPAEHLPRIFEPFFTTKGSLGGGDVPGTGLGLSVVHGIVAAHGGTISVQSELGRGTTFTISLQAAGPQESPTPEPRTTTVSYAPAAVGCGKSVLVADDEDLVRETSCGILTMNGYQADQAASADEAVEALRDTPYDLVIADVRMPGGGAQAVLSEVARLGRAVPVLVITGCVDDGIGEEVMRLGATGCLRKPFTLRELLEEVNELVGGTPGRLSPSGDEMRALAALIPAGQAAPA